jgi:CBS domain-containing protein
MPQRIRDVMSPDPVSCPPTATIVDAAQIMRDRDIGDVLIERDGKLVGLVTDRDIVIRAVASNADPTTPLGQLFSSEVVTVKPTDQVDKVVELMRQRAVRRVPVVENGKAVGIVSLGDLAIERDSSSALADISAAKPDQ